MSIEELAAKVELLEALVLNLSRTADLQQRMIESLHETSKYLSSCQGG